MKIKLNNDISIDLDKLIESRLLIQANSGGGKSYCIRRIIEQAFGHVQIIVLDPEGEFGNLRSKFPFVYAGKDGDTSTDPRSAALLARRLLELKASAIIDLYELPPQERKHFVRLFCEAMVNAPKELWHDCIVVIDEAHVFAPEKSESEALGPVIDLATRGRKRGYCVVLASQRISKLHKDAAAECNNKLIGRTSLDIDRKRAGEELGITNREEILALRNLVPGEFMVFGPAITSEVRRLVIGDVVVKPPKRGVSRTKPPAPSAQVKKILAQLADLPQAAQEEANTVKGLQTALHAAKMKIGQLERSQTQVGMSDKDFKFVVDKVEKERDKYWQAVIDRERTKFLNFRASLYKKLLDSHAKEGSFIEELNLVEQELNMHRAPHHFENNEDISPKTLRNELIRSEAVQLGEGKLSLSKGARAVLTYLHSVYPAWKSKTQLWVAAGYAPGGGFNNIIYELTGSGRIEKDGAGKYAARPAMYGAESYDQTFDPSLSKWDSKLSMGARKIFRILLDNSNEQYNKEYLAGQSGYALGGGFNNLIYELTGKELIIKVGTEYKINPEILDL